MHNEFDLLEPSMTFDNLPLSQPIEGASEKVREFLQASTAEATLKAYRCDIEHFIAWGGVLPACSQLIANYLADHAGSLSVATLERRLAALSKVHKALGNDNPARTNLVRTTMSGIKRTKGKTQRQVAPITKERLLKMVDACDESVRGLRDKAILLIGFSAALRRSEIVALNHNNLEFVPEGMIITIERSKTDQEGQGRKIGVPFAHGEVCPVLTTQQYIKASALTLGPLFRPMKSKTHLGTSRLTATSIAIIIKLKAELAGYNPSLFSGHSLRAGFATTAAQLDVATWSIMQQTGHRSHKSLQRYIRDTSLFKSNAMSAIL